MANNEQALMVQQGGALAPRTDDLANLQRLGNILAASGYFADAREMAQAAVKVMAGQELGIPPIAAMMGFSIIKGKVGMSGNLMAVQLRRHGYDYRFKRHDNTGCVIEFLSKVEGGKRTVLGESSFTEQDAKDAKVHNDMYVKFPRNMYFNRAMSNGCKWFTPEIFGGAPVYTPEELGATVDGEGHVVIDARPEPPPPPPPQTQQPSAPPPPPAPNGGGKGSPAPADPQADEEVQKLYERCKRQNKDTGKLQWDKFAFVSVAHDLKRDIEELCGNDAPYYEVLGGFKMKGFGPADFDAIPGEARRKVNQSCAVIKALYLKLRAIEASAFADQGETDQTETPADVAAAAQTGQINDGMAFAEEANNV